MAQVAGGSHFPTSLAFDDAAAYVAESNPQGMPCSPGSCSTARGKFQLDWPRSLYPPPLYARGDDDHRSISEQPDRTSLRGLPGLLPYRQLWVARTVSQWGDALNTVALALAPFAGALVDRLPRVRVMICVDLGRAALAFGLPYVEGSVLAVYAVAVGLSGGAVFFQPRSPIGAARGREGTRSGGGQQRAVGGRRGLPGRAGSGRGVVVVACGYTWAFWINAASYVISAAVLRRLTLPAPTARSHPRVVLVRRRR